MNKLTAQSVAVPKTLPLGFVRLSFPLGIHSVEIRQINRQLHVTVSTKLRLVKALDQERKARKLESIPETVRAVLGEYFKGKQTS